MDALPIKEATGLPYASTATATDPDGTDVPVMHACGHDMHVTWLAGASALLARSRDAWQGTVLAVFQPAEETAQGARAMIDDGLFDRFPKPEVILGQHVMPAPAGEISYRPGTTQAAADSLEVRLFGRGAHGSMPESSVDPVVMAAATVLRLQTIVSREIAAGQAAVVTVGALQAGTKDNVIPDEALLKLNVRTFDEQVRRRVLDAIERIVKAEAAASGAPQAARDHDHRALPADGQRPRPHRAASPPRCAATSATTACTSSPRRSPPARTSAPSAPNGASPRCSGTSAAPTRTPTARPSRPAASPRTSRPTTTRASPRSSTPRSRPACRPWSPPRSTR